MRTLVHDLLHALRLVRRQPGFAAIVVLTLGLGIAANSTIYGVVDGMVLHPFPFPDADRLVGVGTAYPRLGQDLGFWENLSAPEYADIAAQSRTLRDVVAWDMGNRQISAGGAPVRVFTGFWWGDAFPALGVQPALGRGFRADEIRGGERVALISHRLWQSMFGGDAGVIGRTVQVNGEGYVLIGVMPPRALIYGTDLWLPMWVAPDHMPRDRRQFQVIARLAPGVDLKQANAELATLASGIAAAHAAEFPEYAGWRMQALPWTEVNVRVFKPAALVLVAAVGFLLLLVCVNVSNLLLARGVRRGRELAVRSALGASRGDLIRQFLTESVVLSVAGGAVGLGLGLLGVKAFAAFVARLPIPVPGEAAMNGRVLLATALVALLAGLLAGLLPALRGSSPRPQVALRDEGTGASMGRNRHRLQRVLVGVQVALTLTLLAGGALLVHGFVRLQRIDPGFATRDVLTMRLTLPWERYDGPAITRFFQELERRVEALPGVRSAAAGTQFPPVTFSHRQFRLEGQEVASEGELPNAYATLVTDDYFRTLGVPLLRGRGFESGDVAGGRLVAVINEAAARRFWPGEDPIGRRFSSTTEEGPTFEVVGVAASVKNLGLEKDAAPEVFASIRQAEGWSNQLFLIVRTSVEPRSLLPAIRGAVHSLDPEQPVYSIQTVDGAFATSVAPRRVATLAMTLFALFALLLAALGVYAVASFAVSDRTREMGVRAALGARQAHVRRLVVAQAMVPVAIGGGIGLVLAALAIRSLAEIMGGSGAGRVDLLALGAAVTVLVGVAFLASWLPARRASRLDPQEAMKG